jgi:hypothetical protein
MLGQSTSRTKTAVGVSSVKKIGRRSRDEVDAQPLQHVMARELDGQVRGEPVGTLHNDGPDPVAGNPLQHRHEPGHARSQDQCHSSQRRTASGRLRPSSRSSRTSSDRSGGRGGSIAYRNHLHLSAVAPGIESVVIFVLGLSITGPNLIE